MLLNWKLRFAFDSLLRALETLLSKFAKKINFFLFPNKKKKQADKFNISSRHFKYLRVKKKNKLVPTLLRFSLFAKILTNLIIKVQERQILKARGKEIYKRYDPDNFPAKRHLHQYAKLTKSADNGKWTVGASL